MTGAKPTRRRSRRGTAFLWEQVLSDLRKRMAKDEFEQGFPTDRELMHTYGVSRHTAREAARRLQEEGVLRRHKGRGSFVQPLALEQRVGPLYSLFRSIEDQGHIQRSDVLQLSSVSDATVAKQMGLAPKTKFFYLRRLRRADGVPFAIDEIWLPAAIARPLFKVNFEHTAVYTELERLTNVRPVHGWERIRPVLADSSERRLLGIDHNQPVFVINRYTESDRGPLEWRTTVVRGDTYTFITTWSGAEISSAFDAGGRGTTSKKRQTLTQLQSAPRGRSPRTRKRRRGSAPNE